MIESVMKYYRELSQRMQEATDCEEKEESEIVFSPAKKAKQLRQKTIWINSFMLDKTLEILKDNFPWVGGMHSPTMTGNITAYRTKAPDWLPVPTQQCLEILHVGRNHCVLIIPAPNGAKRYNQNF
eukprot:g70551.t1